MLKRKYIGVFNFYIKSNKNFKLKISGYPE